MKDVVKRQIGVKLYEAQSHTLFTSIIVGMLFHEPTSKNMSKGARPNLF
jgi:hypothetical protein